MYELSVCIFSMYAHDIFIDMSKIQSHGSSSWYQVSSGLAKRTRFLVLYSCKPFESSEMLFMGEGDYRS